MSRIKKVRPLKNIKIKVLNIIIKFFSNYLSRYFPRSLVYTVPKSYNRFSDIQQKFIYLRLVVGWCDYWSLSSSSLTRWDQVLLSFSMSKEPWVLWIFQSQAKVTDKQTVNLIYRFIFRRIFKKKNFF